MSRKRNQSIKQNSALEQNFIVQNAFKRNKRYVNFQRINKIQRDYEHSRRRPFSSSQKSMDQKISSSFMNTTAAFSDKVEQQIDKFKLRMSGINRNDEIILCQSRNTMRSFTPNSQNNFRSNSSGSLNEQKRRKKKIRGMAIEKYCSRQQYYRCKNKPVVDQRLFNNYSEQQPDLVHIRDFQKDTGRDLDFALKNFHELEYNTQKLYGDYYYKKTTMQCNFDYKTQKKTPRQLSTPKRPQDIPTNQLSPQKVKQSYNKSSVSNTSNIEGFYANTGRQLPTQLDMRFNTNLTNYWVDNRGKIVKKTKQYSLRKMKSDLVQAKISQIAASKKPYFQREQLCDKKYFRVHRQI